MSPIFQGESLTFNVIVFLIRHSNSPFYNFISYFHASNCLCFHVHGNSDWHVIILKFKTSDCCECFFLLLLLLSLSRRSISKYLISSYNCPIFFSKFLIVYLYLPILLSVRFVCLVLLLLNSYYHRKLLPLLLFFLCLMVVVPMLDF